MVGGLCEPLRAGETLGLITAVAVVGLEETFYNVSESVGEVELCVIVYQPQIQCPISFPFIVALGTRQGTASQLCSFNNFICSLLSMACSYERRLCGSADCPDV